MPWRRLPLLPRPRARGADTLTEGADSIAIQIDDEDSPGAASDDALAHAHHLDAPGDVHAELAGAVLTRHGPQPGIEIEPPQRRDDPAGQPLEARTNVELGVRIGTRPGERHRCFEERCSVAASEPDDGIEAPGPGVLDGPRVARAPRIEAREEQRDDEEETPEEPEE